MAQPVLRHRILTNFNAEAEGVKPDDIIRRLIEGVRVEEDGRAARELPPVLK
jgi:MoxR-like ATPase